MSSDEGVTPRKKSRVEKKRIRTETDEEEEDRPTSSRKTKAQTKEKSPERKRKGKKAPTPQAPVEETPVEPPRNEEEEEGDDDDDEDLSDGARTENGVDHEGSTESDEVEKAKERINNGTEDDIFEIPQRDDDLLFQDRSGYKIDEVMNTEEAMEAVEKFEDEIMSSRWRTLYERFPAFFALVRSPSEGTRVEVPAALRSRLVTSLILTYTHMSPFLKKTLSKAASGPPKRRVRAMCRDLADHVLMLIYLLYKLIVIFEDEAKTIKKKPVKKLTGRGRPKKGKAVQNEDGDMLSGGDDEYDVEESMMEGATEDESTWEESRQKVLETLTEIVNITVVNKEGKTVEFALKYLWKGTYDKQTFTTLLMSAVKFLGNPAITKAPAKPLLVSVFKLIRALCINFRQFTFIGGYLFETLISLDYYKEGSKTVGTPEHYPFIKAIKAAAVNKDMDKLIEGMIEHFRKYQTAVSANNARALGDMLRSMTEQEPTIVFFRVQPFLTLLSDDNQTIRTAILNVIQTLLLQDFLNPLKHNLSERFASARNNLFDHLLQHIRDHNAVVRAAALKCLTKMASEHRIPTDLIKNGLIQLVGQRISDEKPLVRKAAVQFATEFLLNNPYGHDFNRVSVEKALKDLIEKRDVLRREATTTEEQDRHSVQEAENVFNSFKDALAKDVEKYAEEVVLECFNVPDDNERKEMYRAFKERQDAAQHGGTSMSQSFSQLAGEDITMRWLYTMILSEENEVEVPARLLVSMAMSDQLKGEHLSKRALTSTIGTENMVRKLMDAGHYLFVNTASMIIGRDDEAILQKEKDTARRKEKLKKYSKDIDDLFMKLVLEHELAKCLPSVMAAVMGGDANDRSLGVTFVVKCKEFGISGSEAAVRTLCGLVWKSDSEGRDKILDEASKMFLSSHPNPQKRNVSTCENILNLVKSMSDHERGSVEQVLALTTRSNPIPAGVYTLLWEQVDEESIGKPDLSDGKMKKQLTAIKALCLLSRSDVDRNRKWLRRYQNIVKEGGPEIAGEALGCIANLANRNTREEKTPAVDAPAYRISHKDSLFHTIEQFILAELCREEAQTWNRSLRAALDIYFHICKETCAVVSELVSKVLWLLRRTSQALHYYDQQVGGEITAAPRRTREETVIDPRQKEVVAEDRSKYLTRLWSVLAERLCVLAGELAVRFLVHTDYVFVREFIKARQGIMKKPPVPFPKRSLKEWEENSLLRRGIFDWGTGNAEDEECTGLSEDERIRELARTLVDDRLSHAHSLLGRLLPIVVHSVRAKGTPPRVRFQAVNALAKYMLVSPDIAKSGARTFFAFLNNAPSPILRSNLMVVAGDLTFRHPNLVENHSDSLFGQLQDNDTCVREACVLILNHLISNDLIKTNVHLSYALTGYIDAVPSINHLTKGLFHEWSKKEGIMNHVPSFITRLAGDSRELPLELFKRIMDQFIPLIRERKDADVQALVIKLCKRIEYAKNPACLVKNPDMAAYFSYCLSLLTLNAKGFHKLVDCLEQYAPYLGDERVYNNFYSIVDVFKKEDGKANGAHSDLAAEISLFLHKLTELHHQNRKETEVEGVVARMHFGKKEVAAARKQQQVRGRLHKAPAASVASSPVKGGPTTRRGRKKKYIDSDSDSDE